MNAQSQPLAPATQRRRDAVDDPPGTSLPAANTEAPERREHVVKRGDTLTSIAAEHGTDVSALLQQNPSLRRNPNRLRIGERVALPEAERARADDATVAASRGRAAAQDVLARARVNGPEDLGRGASGPAVRELQGQLNATGSARPLLEVDGDLGRRTEAAIKRYQSSRGLTPSGVADQATRAALAERRPAEAKDLEMGAFGPDVRALQQQLNGHGARLTEDGDFGAGTERAVRAFQRANRLTDDGVVGTDTRAALAREDVQPIPAGSDNVTTATGYRQGRAFQIELVPIGNGESMSRPAGEAFLEMKDAARRDGVNLNVVSGFRTNDEQRALYRAYQRGRGNLAAPPGYSNHQNGIAVDITTGGSRRSASYRWLAENGARFGFANTVASEPWHWEYRR